MRLAFCFLGWTSSRRDTGVGISTLGMPKSLSKAGSTQVSLGSAASESTAAAEAGAWGTSVSICSCVKRGKPAVRPAARSDASRVFGKDARGGAPALGTGAIMRGQACATTIAEYELGMLGTVARTNVCVAIGAERGAVLYGLKAMRADHGFLFSEQFIQSRLEHNIATPPQEQGTNSTSPG